MAEEIIKEVQGGIADFFNESKHRHGALDGRSVLKADKASVLQAARDFHDCSIVKEKPKECLQTITQILHLQSNTSHHLSPVEATEIFFGITKLFVSTDSALRRMVYVVLKELYLLCDPSDVIIVTSCLTKDMTCKKEIYRANALRVLVRIIDTAMLSAIERYVKQAIIHNSPTVSSSALVSSMHLFHRSVENASIVKRWVGEVNEAMKSPNHMVQYHATQLFYQIKANDRLAVSKFVQKHSGVISSSTSSSSSSASRIKNRVRSPLAIICLIRYTSKLLHEEVMEGRAAPDASIMEATELCSIGYRYLESCLSHESAMVSYEAARAICTLPTSAPEVILPALPVLYVSISSTKPATRLAAVKLMFGLASLHPNIVARYNESLEALVGDSNRLIGTLAIMTLLKTGTELSMDRLLKSISSFMYHISAEYKIMVLQSLEKLCITFPSKFRIVLGLMSKFLRDEGRFSLKKSIVDRIVSLMNQMPDTRERALLHLCEFIEDCEFVALSTEILHLLGKYGPMTTCPARYVRFMYNRCILENSMVRSAAISALAKFAVGCPQLRKSILLLLKSCSLDENDEARDRVVLSIALLENEGLDAVNCGENDESHEDKGDGSVSKEDPAVIVLGTALPISFNNLEQRLKAYKAIPGAMESSDRLVLSALPIIEETSEVSVEQGNDISDVIQGGDSILHQARGNAPSLDPSAVIYSIPEFASFGRVFRTCTPIALTEAESEYVVHCVKHIMDQHVIIQFIVQNTIEDQRLENVSVAIHGDSDVFQCVGELPVESISYGTTASCFTVLEKNEMNFTATAFSCELKFCVVDVDAGTGEELGEHADEEYPLEEFEIFIADFMAKTPVADFRSAWENTGNKNEILQKFGLAEKTIINAANAVIDCMGMQTCDGTGTIKPGAKVHMLHLSGTFLGGIKVFARCQISATKGGTVILKMAIRSNRMDVSKLVSDCMC